MRTKYVLLLAAFIATVCATAARADIPIVQADTIFAGFGGGSVTGIVFGPTGETVILMHDAQPVEIDIKTKQVLREFEKVPNASGAGEQVKWISGENYLTGVFSSTEIMGKTNFIGTVIWDFATGKIINSLHKYYLVVNGNQTFTWQSGKSYFYRYDVITFKKVDSMYIDPNLEGNGKSEWCKPAIIPNSNKILFGVNRYNEFEPGQKDYKQAELYLLDFDSKEFTKIPIPYESWQKDARISSITVSETGKYNIVSINIYNVYYYYFYDRNMNYLYKMTLSDFEQLTNTSNIFNTSLSLTLTDDYLIFYISSNDFKVRKMFSYDIQEKKILKYLSFIGTGLYNKTSQKIAFYGNLGITGIYSLDALPVQDNSYLELTETIQYKDSNLIINSSSAEKVDITITDYNGVLLHTKRNMFLQKGANVIKINVPLGTGVYFCIVKSSAGSNSFKFMVSK